MGENRVIKCSSCSKLIARGFINDGSIEIKCKCGTVNTIAKEPKETNRQQGSGLVLGNFSIDRIST